MKKDKLQIIYEDKYLIVVNKKSGILTISTDKEKENTLYSKVKEYLKKQNKNNKVFIVHRLDKDTSGLVIFAKSMQIKKILQDNWNKVIRKYVGIVNCIIPKEKDVIKNFLAENKMHYVYCTNNKKGKLAITEYIKLDSNKKYSLLLINILTGRKHQIRVQLSDLGYPLVGDTKYSKIKNKGIKRLYLHAIYLEFPHPITKEIIKLKTEIPSSFDGLLTFKKSFTDI